MPVLRPDLKADLRAAGFKKSVRSGYLRGPNDEQVEHHIFLEPARKAFIGSYQVAVAVRHNAIERSFIAAISELGEKWRADRMRKSGGGFALGVTLGYAPQRELSWTTPITWFDGSTLTLEEADSTLSTIQTLRDIHARIVSPSSHRESWAILTHHDALRWLIIYEWLRKHDPTWHPAPDEIDRLRNAFSDSPFIEGRTFDAIREIARSVI